MGGAQEGENPCPKLGSVANQRWFSEVVQGVLEGQVRSKEGVSGGEGSVGKCGKRLQEGPSWGKEGVNEMRAQGTHIEVLSKAGNKGTAENSPEGRAVGHLGGCCGRVPLLACTHTCMLSGDSPLADSSCLSQRCQEYVCGGAG